MKKTLILSLFCALLSSCAVLSNPGVASALAEIAIEIVKNRPVPAPQAGPLLDEPTPTPHPTYTAVPIALVDKQKFGLSYLGGAQYTRIIKEYHPKGHPARFFVQPDLFGDPRNVIAHLIEEKEVRDIAINLSWKDNHNFGTSEMQAAVKLYKERWVSFIKSYPSVTFYVSGATEHNLKAIDALALAKNILAVSPDNVVYVNNPLPKFGGHYIIGERIIQDVHGKDAAVRGKYLYDWDGTNMVDDDVRHRLKKHKRAQIIFIWHPAFNGRLKTDDKTPRPERKSWPTGALIKSLTDTVKFATKRNQGKIWLPNRAIYKTHADRHTTPPEPRAYKPVLLSNIAADRVEMKALNGKVLCVSDKKQPFKIAPNTSRHYFGMYGTEIARLAVKNGGKPIVFLVANNKVIGRVNPALRAGMFR